MLKAADETPQEAAPKRERSKRTVRPAPQIVQQGGDGSLQVANSTIQNIHFAVPERKAVRVVVQPGPQHIDGARAAEVRELVGRVVSVTGEKHSFVWATVKRKYRFVQYQLLTPDVYIEVCKYLRKWIASRSAKPTGDNEEHRKRLLRRIYAEARKTHGVIDRIRVRVAERWDVRSLADLTPDQLVDVIREFGL
ncbi:hypothetical protein AC731_007045 [Thauera humireducens]|uniref:Uncharacterized protein n=1 Tax=Thauera humireducens TaxID=1134435 RepID=A0A127K436_9RHOO|nr:hypothetical protein AC731_007045 [Thauera humireducens]